MLLPGGELKTVRGHAQWQDTPLGRSMQGCQQLCGETPQAARLSGESNGSAADTDACSARDNKPSVQRPASYGPRGSQAASRADRLTPSRASLACRGWKTPTPLRLTVSRAKTR
ncbi:thimet oligopeptidase [Trypanosoma cruzi]|nr:thimet oligopeptidase [Trypanosoma cruzi]RNC54751.1 thimet oligopeptidase [Trypanosoma cruzi]